MRDKKKLNRQLAILFSLSGLASLVFVLKDYGISHLSEEMGRSGGAVFILAFTFIPTLVCYALSWLLATDHHLMKGEFSLCKKTILFTKYSLMSIAWNNLTPFLKIGGEPLKYMLLSQHMAPKIAMASTVNYNLIHLLATAISFLLATLVLTLRFHLESTYLFMAIGLFVVLMFLFFVVHHVLHTSFMRLLKEYHFYFFRRLFLYFKIGLRGLVLIYKKNPKRFMSSVFLDVGARFVEGLTFYYAFALIHHPISFLSATLLDVGRTLIDTLFFFIPYQIGAREEGVHFFMKNVLFIDAQGFLSAVLLYRFVEIIWMAVGYALWLSSRRSVKVFTVKSATLVS